MPGKTLGSQSRIYALRVDTTPKLLVPRDPRRTGLLVVNNTAGSVVYILKSQTHSILDGIPLEYRDSYHDVSFSGEIWIVSDTDNTNVRVKVDSE